MTPQPASRKALTTGSSSIGDQAVSVKLALDEMRLVVAGDAQGSGLDLHGRTPEKARDWFSAQVHADEVDAPRLPWPDSRFPATLSRREVPLRSIRRPAHRSRIGSMSPRECRRRWRPGEAQCPAPYAYASPWPPPWEEDRPLARGHWHAEGWVGAVLTADQLVGG